MRHYRRERLHGAEARDKRVRWAGAKATDPCRAANTIPSWHNSMAEANENYYY